MPQESFKPDKQTTSNHNVWFHLNVAIEKILKVGGMIYILIGIIYNVYMALNNHQSHVSALKIISYLCYTLISTILLGLFYYGMGRIIELLREGLSNEKR
ncbi:MAG TPA: hypothetical protein DDW65_23515 [Firmicutes bacterium]|nr:hypothetical protein [Bacillota bacterium]